MFLLLLESVEVPLANLVLGQDASSSNSVVGDVDCFNFSQSENGIKEGLEVFLLRLKSSDLNVCLGRDLTVVNVLPNGGEACLNFHI